MPDTEKYFDKWKDLFLTMLIMFPAFSVVFGGSQLAGTAIIQNANTINTVLLGMAVQVAPLAITPLLLKFSGSLLGKIAGFANNPKRGLLDRTRNWAQDRSEKHKDKILSDPNRRALFGGTTRAIDHRRRKNEAWKATNKSLADSHWLGTDDAHAIHAANARAHMIKETNEAAGDRHVEVLKRTNAEMQALDLNARAEKIRLDLAKAKVEANWEEFRAGENHHTVTPEGLSASALANFTRNRDQLAAEMQNVSREAALTGYRQKSAERFRNEQLTQELLNADEAGAPRIDGQTLTGYAGGILGDAGAASVLATAVAQERQEYDKYVKEKIHLTKQFNLDSKQLFDLALGEDVSGTDNNGRHFSFKAGDKFAREAAIERKLREGSFSEIEKIIKESGKDVTIEGKDSAGNVTVENRTGKTSQFATSINTLIPELKLQNKAIYFGSQTIDEVGQGALQGDVGLDNAAARVLLQGKIKEDELAGMNASAIERIIKMADLNNARGTAAFAGATADQIRDYQENVQSLKYSAWRVMNTGLLRRSADQAAQRVLGGFGEQPPDMPASS